MAPTDPAASPTSTPSAKDRQSGEQAELDAGSARRDISRPAFVLGLLWVVAGAALAAWAYNDKMVVVDGGGIHLLRNDQGLAAGVAAVAFGLLCCGVGAIVRARSRSREGSSAS